MNYKIILDPEVSVALDEIYNYISNVLLSKQGALSTLRTIHESIKLLAIFPEAGFNVDERLKFQLYPDQKTYGSITKGGRYLIFYHLIPQNADTTVIYVSNLVSAKTNWVNYFNSN